MPRIPVKVPVSKGKVPDSKLPNHWHSLGDPMPATCARSDLARSQIDYFAKTKEAPRNSQQVFEPHGRWRRATPGRPSTNENYEKPKYYQVCLAKPGANHRSKAPKSPVGWVPRKMPRPTGDDWGHWAHPVPELSAEMPGTHPRKRDRFRGDGVEMTLSDKQNRQHRMGDLSIKSSDGDMRGYLPQMKQLAMLDHGMSSPRAPEGQQIFKHSPWYSNQYNGMYFDSPPWKSTQWDT